jgi:hypothetical protein
VFLYYFIEHDVMWILLIVVRMFHEFRLFSFTRRFNIPFLIHGDILHNLLIAARRL